MAKFKITTEDGTFVVDAPDQETALAAMEQEGDSLKPKPSAARTAVAVASDVWNGTPLAKAQRMGLQAGEYLVENGPDIAAGIVDSGKKALTLGDRVVKGDVRMTDDAGRTSPELIEEAFNAATWALPSSPASTVATAIPKTAEKVAPEIVLTEGQKAAKAAANISVELPRAVTSDSVSVQNVGKKLSQTALVGTPIRNAYKKAASQTDEAAQRVQDELGTGKVEVAGNRIKQDVAKFAIDDEPKAVKALYDKLKTQINPERRIQMSETAKVAADIIRTRAAADATPSKAVDRLRDALMRREGKNYEELKTLREDFRALKDNPKALASLDMNQRHVNDLYDALSSDLRAAAKAGGGDEALKTFNEANNRSYLFHRDKKELRKILGEGSDENMATKLTALAGNTSRANIKGLALARSKVSKETWDELASTVIDDLARNPTNAEFTPDKFVTKWNKLSDSGKKLLFAPEQRQALEDIAAVSSRLKQMNEFANHSGTASAVNLGVPAVVAGAGMFVNPLIVAGTGVSVLGGRVMSEILARPASAKALAEYSKAYELAAKSPSQTAQNLLANKAQALALIAANGNKEMASSIAGRIAAVQNVAAIDEEEEPGGPVSKPKADKADPELNELITQGRAF